MLSDADARRTGTILGSKADSAANGVGEAEEPQQSARGPICAIGGPLHKEGAEAIERDGQDGDNTEGVLFDRRPTEREAERMIDDGGCGKET